MSIQTLILPAGTDISPGSSVETEFRVKLAEFGDGYIQRSGDGINSVRDTYTVSVENLRKEEADPVVAFLKARRGWEAFLWTPPRETVPRKWICKDKVKRTHVGGTVDTLSYTLIEVFDP
jgi:phage-related protein